MKLFAVICFCLLSTGFSALFGGPSEKPLEDGDIIFHRSQSRQSHAIAAATGSQFTHMGIIFREGDEIYVYEAIQPVKKTKLDDWVKRGKDRKFVVRRLKDRSEIDMAKVKEEIDGFLGLDYDIAFSWSDSEIYCSELVWKAYQRAAGIEIGEPKKLKDFSLTHYFVRKLMEERYGKKVPLDMVVISPGDMYDSPLLETVMEVD